MTVPVRAMQPVPAAAGDAGRWGAWKPASLHSGPGRGAVPGSTPADALRTFARDGRLIVLRGDRRWVYPRFQLDHFDPRDPDNIVAMINRMLDAGHYPEAATAWWTAPADSLPDRRSPMGLLGQDHATLRELAAMYAAAAEL